jgi:hypothetical protein
MISQSFKNENCKKRCRILSKTSSKTAVYTFKVERLINGFRMTMIDYGW